MSIRKNTLKFLYVPDILNEMMIRFWECRRRTWDW